jgi:hypothetical protein
LSGIDDFLVPVGGGLITAPDVLSYLDADHGSLCLSARVLSGADLPHLDELPCHACHTTTP